MILEEISGLNVFAERRNQNTEIPEKLDDFQEAHRDVYWQRTALEKKFQENFILLRRIAFTTVSTIITKVES